METGGGIYLGCEQEEDLLKHIWRWVTNMYWEEEMEGGGKEEETYQH